MPMLSLEQLPDDVRGRLLQGEVIHHLRLSMQKPADVEVRRRPSSGSWSLTSGSSLRQMFAKEPALPSSTSISQVPYRCPKCRSSASRLKTFRSLAATVQ